MLACTAGRGTWALSRVPDPLSLSRLVLLARRPVAGRPRPARVRHAAGRSAPRASPGRLLGRLRVREPGSGRRAAARLSRPAADAAGALPAARAALALVTDHRGPGELGGGA